MVRKYLHQQKNLYFFPSLQIPLHSQKNENENLYVLDKGNEIIYSKIYHSRLVSSKITLIYDLINEQLPNRTSRY